jgi:hypothetical protein
MGWDGDRDKRYSSEEGSAHDIRLLAHRSKQQRHQSLTDVPRLSALPVLHLPRQAYRLHVYLGIDIMCRWCLPCVSAGDAPRQPDRGPRGLLHLLVVLCHHPVASVEVSGSETFGVMDVSNLRIWPKGSARKCIR